MSKWPSIADLVVESGPAEVALVGAPMDAKSVNPAAYAEAPAAVRRTLRRFATYDVVTGRELGCRILDAGDAAVEGLIPEDAFGPIVEAAGRCTRAHALTILLGGHNGVTRPAAHALGLPLDRIGLVTLDAHFDLRDTDEGLMNGNPVRALIEDGLPGRNICQLGLAPYANTAAMHAFAREAGIGVWTIADLKRHGIAAMIGEALARLGHCELLMVDFDIDVIDRAQCPGAPGARPGGLSADMFFEAARLLAAEPKVRLVDLTEFDPGRDVAEITALTAGRWVCEVLAGFSER